MALTDFIKPANLTGKLFSASSAAGDMLRKLTHALSALAPKRLYTRTLLIMILPIVALEGVVAFVFMERHWQAVTHRLSEATARDVAAIVDLYKDYKKNDDFAGLRSLARNRLNLSFEVLPPGDLPPPQSKPFFALLDRTLSDEIRKRLLQAPFWIDTVGNSRHVEIKVKLDDAILRFVARRSQTYASNSHIFLVWMILTSIILLSVAILFLTNQIKPILRLAEAADAFGKGRATKDVGDITPRGAHEIRMAAAAFNDMRQRITQHVEQRTAMFAAISHDLRTILTRLKLQLALLGNSADIENMQQDINEMQHMLEEYLAFAKGDGGEEISKTHVVSLIEEVITEAQVHNIPVTLDCKRKDMDIVAPLKRNAFKRALTNLVSNAGRFADRVQIRVAKGRRSLLVTVEDNGPGIPPEERENVFNPFYRIDHARNQDKGNSGLGLAITRDIARSHGGDVTLHDSSLGGLSAQVRVPW